MNIRCCSLSLHVEHFTLGMILLMACHWLHAEDYHWNLPNWMPPPEVPVDNPMSQSKVVLGQRLFFDANLSGLGYMACSNCHIPEQAFAEKRPVSVGVTGQFHRRNAMAIVNVAYMKTLTWANPNEVRLEDQSKVPLFGEHPVEMGTKDLEQKVILFLQRDPIYPGKV